MKFEFNLNLLPIKISIKNKEKNMRINFTKSIMLEFW